MNNGNCGRDEKKLRQSIIMRKAANQFIVTIEDNKLSIIEKSVPYLVQEHMTVAIDKIAGAVDLGLQRSPTASFVSRLVYHSRSCTV